MVPLFDTNAHPALAAGDKTESFSVLKQRLADAGFIGACAVALPADGDLDHSAFFDAGRAHGFYSVAGWQNVPAADIEGRVAALFALGYRAIKIHPRRSGLSVRDPRFGKVLRAAASAGVTVFHCSYQFGVDNGLHPVDPLPTLMEAVAASPGVRMVLLHGGTVEVLRYAECIRSNHNLLLDLSFTLNRYLGSSLDLDLAYLFRTFDQRICVGTDYPDYQPADVRARFEELSTGLSKAKRDNIGWRNIMGFLGLARE
jgi:predicted TIM-barrel fold metal-dependent hydrolase